MAFKSRPPTGKPPWPIILIAGIQKTGKSFSAAEASASPYVDRTLWIGVGEDDPDEYKNIPGARFEIGIHDGTYQGILQSVTEAVNEPSDPARPNMIVMDSGSMLWQLIVDNVQLIADRREKNRGQITMDLWNKAASQWKAVMAQLNRHNGPVVITARMNEVTVMKGGKPTTEKTWKHEGHKSLPFDVGVIVEFEAPRAARITGARSLRHDVPLGEHKPFPNFTLSGLWEAFGYVEPGNTAPRQHSGTQPVAEADPVQRDWLTEASVLSSVDGLRALYMDAQAAEAPPEVLAGIQGMAAQFAAPQAVDPPSEPSGQ